MQQDLNLEQLAKMASSHVNQEIYNPTKPRVSQRNLEIIDLPTFDQTTSKITDLESAIKGTGLKSGMTISFHHHFRNGDKTMRKVMDVIEKMGLKDLTIASSSFTDASNFFTELIEKGVVKQLETSGCRDELGQFISSGKDQEPMIIRSHGGRARAIESGELKIDVAFIAASSSDEMGNANGVLGKSICGSLGYAIVDANNARKTVILTDTIVDFPNKIISIPQTTVDFVVELDEIGDPTKIMSGEIRLSSNPKEEIIARKIADVVTNTCYFKEGFSIQMGTGGASLSAVKQLEKVMVEKNITASFCLGGITSHQVSWLEKGLVKTLLDTQSFDLVAAKSLLENKNHLEISASEYANPDNKSAFVNKLDYVILSALEVDTDFNVNVITGSDGIIRGASGGHSDTAQAAKVTIVALPLIRGRLSCVVDRVTTIVTPGSTVDVVITDYGIAVNPKRQDLIEQLHQKHIKTISLEEMMEFAYSIIGRPEPIDFDYDQPVAVVEYRDGSIIDIIYKAKES